MAHHERTLEALVADVKPPVAPKDSENDVEMIGALTVNQPSAPQTSTKGLQQSKHTTGNKTTVPTNNISDCTELTTTTFTPTKKTIRKKGLTSLTDAAFDLRESLESAEASK